MFTIDQLQLLPPNKWEDLENLVKELFRAEWQDIHTQRHGRRGQSQQGVDVFGRPASVPGWAGVQCKNKDLLILSQLTVEELRGEVKKAKAFQPPLTQLIIATTAPRDGRLQQEARKITDRHLRRGSFSVHVYAWDDILELLAKHERVATQYYGNVAGIGTSGRPPLLSEGTMATAFAAIGTESEEAAQAPSAPLVLPAFASRALGIVATSPVTLTEEGYRSLFPEIDWKAALPALRAANAIAGDASGLHVPKPTKESFLRNATDSRPYLDVWVAALEPLREHVDMALLLSLLYLARHEYVKAVDVVAKLATALEPGMWNELYRSVLQAYSLPKFLNRLSAEQRVLFFNAYGLCLARGQTPGDALPWAARMRRESERNSDNCGLGQSFLLAGIAHQGRGEFEKAAAQFRQAASHARRHRIPLLVGHALHNLAMLQSHIDPAGAARLLEESILAKKQARDEPGRVGGMIGRGLLAASQGQSAQAEKWFVRAEKLAASLDMRHARTIALCNIATSLVEQDRPADAIPRYKAAQNLAEEEGFVDSLALTLGGEAVAHMALNRFARAHACFLRLHKIRRDMGQQEAAAIALHDAGICLMKQRKGEEARETLRTALDEAHEAGVAEWAYRCNNNIAFTYAEEGNPEHAIAALREAALAEQKDRRFGVAARLWESLATMLADQSAEPALIEDAFLQAISAMEQEADSVAERLRLLSGLYVCRWSYLAFDRALDALREMERIARDARRPEALCSALDQRGTCLQQLGRPEEAITEHRAALAIARRLPETMLAENCLNNLGEAYRKTKRTADAVRAYREAEALAHARGDKESAIITAHNRALALEDAGRLGEAARVLRTCRDSALRLDIWDQYVRALHGLANHAWLRSKPDEAISLYRTALEEAKKHGVWEEIAPLSRNYANALRYQGQPRLAFKVLKGVLDDSVLQPDAHDFLAELASVASEIGDFGAAKDYWSGSWEHAALVGDAPGMALASAGLAAVLEQEGDFKHADEALLKALSQSHGPEQQALLLKQRLGLLLRAGHAQKAGRVFSRLRVLTEEHMFREQFIDAHMVIGDHDWATAKSRVQAARAYTAALAKSFELGLEVVVRVGAHTARQLQSLPAEDRLQQIDRLERSLAPWLKQQIGEDQDADLASILLWPLRLARHATLAEAKGQALSENQFVDFVHKELFESTSKRSRK